MRGAGGNLLFTGYATFLLWFVSCLANLCLRPQTSLNERIGMTESTQTPTPRKAVLHLSCVHGESGWYTQNREGHKTRESRVRDTSLVIHLENVHFGHFCWLERELMKMKHQQNKKVVLNYWESIFSHGYMRNRLYYLSTS